MSLAARSRRPALTLALLPVLAVLTGCGGAAPATSTGTAATSSAPTSSAPTSSVPASSPATSSPAAGTPASTTTGCGTALQITVRGTTVTPAPGTTDVKAGCEVDLTITADRSSEVHVHVAELEEPITAGKPLRVTFTPRQTGVYEVELHEPELLLVKLAVR